jgi:ribosomal protein L29
MTSMSELRDFGNEHLEKRVRELDDSVFRMRIQKSMGKTDGANKMRELRRERAQVKTILRERTLNE